MEKEEQSINNISHIFDAITEIIEEEGLPAVTFSSVAKKCFLHRTSVAYYFEGKENMLSQYFRYMQDQYDYKIPHLYPGCDPVELFCKFIDNRIEMAMSDLPWLRAKYKYLLEANPDDTVLQAFTVHVWETQFSQIRPFIDAGIICDRRFKEGMALWYSFGASLRFQALFGKQRLFQEYIIKEGAEKLKRTFLKDGLYPDPGTDDPQQAAPAGPPACD